MSGIRHPRLADALIARGYETSYLHNAGFRYSMWCLDGWLTELDEALDAENIPADARTAVTARLLDRFLPETRPEVERARLAATVDVGKGKAASVPVLDVHADDPEAEADRYAGAVEEWSGVPDRLDAEWHRRRGV